MASASKRPPQPERVPRMSGAAATPGNSCTARSTCVNTARHSTAEHGTPTSKHIAQCVILTRTNMQARKGRCRRPLTHDGKPRARHACCSTQRRAQRVGCCRLPAAARTLLTMSCARDSIVQHIASICKAAVGCVFQQQTYTQSVTHQTPHWHATGVASLKCYSA